VDTAILVKVSSTKVMLVSDIQKLEIKEIIAIPSKRNGG